VEGDSDKPQDPVAFIRECVLEGRVLWTYHVNMRMAVRSIASVDVVAAGVGFELLEAYPTERAMPCYLVLGQSDGPLHVVFAIDRAGDTVRVVTAYRPDPEEWSPDFRQRRRPA
jgi:hypothetical protein